MMRQFIFFLIFFNACEFLQAQYTIPGASQQPAWVFPIWIEDSLGRKDTVYIGYDSHYSTVYGCYDDGYFNEVFQYFDPTDTTTLNAFLCLHSFGGNNDSIKKCEVINNVSNYDLWVYACYYPIKLKWDTQLFYSDSLPFSDQDPLPRAQGELDWSLFPNQVQGCFDSYYPVLMSDTCNSYPCCKIDSVVVYGQGSNGSVGSSLFSLAIKPWTGNILLGIPENTNRYGCTLSPNVVLRGDPIKIISDDLIYNVIFFDAKGRVVQQQKVLNNMIETAFLMPDIYFLQLCRANDFETQKVIIY